MAKVFRFSAEWLIRIAIAAVAAWWAYESTAPFWDDFMRVMDGASPQHPFRNWPLLLDALKWLASQTIAVSIGAIALGHPALSVLYLIAGSLLIQLPLLLVTAIFCAGILGLLMLFGNVGLLLLVIATAASVAVLYGTIFIAIGLFYDAEW
ncbi:hypothetical protein LOS78_12835 [Paracoccus sp. MA]|uniref:hypothetical protein n=1 Tax=Paracoccus sp. MA TaxID=2895796 RepID=UPI001E62B0F6|nr:hypothetical protein [Paracoccus sp. MA]UFM66812.1 hypothetical protein LOS78_12835 [Paracoccus sp. MA]